MGTRNDDMSLILTKAKKQGFLPDVYDSEVDMLGIEAKKLFADDNTISYASQLGIRRLKGYTRKYNTEPTLMASPPTVSYNLASTIVSNKKTWPLLPPINPSANAGPATLTGSLVYGTVGTNNAGSAPLYADAKIGDTTILLKERTGNGALATGNYRIEPPATIADGFSLDEHLSGEYVTISSVTGASAPYTATLSAPLKKPHRVDSPVNTLLVNNNFNPTYYLGAMGAWNGQFGDQALETITDAPLIEILCRFNGLSYRLWIDGELVTQNLATAQIGGAGQPTNNSMGHITIDFGGVRKLRRIRYETTVMKPTAIITTNVDTVVAPPSPAVRVLWISDSFFVQDVGRDGIAPIASRILGWNGVMVDQIGGTGYVAINGTYSTIKQRLNSHIASKPDVIVIASGLNDAWTSTYQETVRSTLQGLRDGCPGVPIFVVGPWSNGTVTNTNKITVAQAIRDATATINNAYFIDTLLGTGGAMNPWVIGTGKTGSPVGDGNADFVIDTDGTHPSRTWQGGYGERYYATRIANAILDLI